MKYFCQFLLLVYSVQMYANLPGRIDREEISFAEFGKCKIFFYMTKEKDELCRNFIDHVNEDMCLTLGQAALPCPTREILVQAIKYPERDPVGTELLRKYAEQTHMIAEDALGLSITGHSWYMNLNLNWEALKIHQDRFVEQYAFMEKESLNPSDWTLVQDLTLIDWQMAENTLAGTMVQDGENGDRYILVVFPKEVVGTFYTENAVLTSRDKKQFYPGHITMPPHSTIAPMDYVAGCTCGSAKGKRMSTITRGIAKRDEVDQLIEVTQQIDINRRQVEMEGSKINYVYSDGAVIKSLLNKAHSLNRNHGMFFNDIQNIQIESVPIKDNSYISDDIREQFHIDNQKVAKIYLLTKRDGGFSSLGELGFDFPDQCRIIAVNFSSVPDGYRHFHLAQDWTHSGRPWIQLYDLPPGMAMEIPPKLFKKLSLTPAEELLYRSEVSDRNDPTFSKTMPAFKSQIALFVFEDLQDVVSKAVHTPAEYGTQQSLFLTWSDDSAKSGMPYSKVILEVICALSDKFPTKLLYNEKGDKERISMMVRELSKDLPQLELIHAPTSTIWIRDTGPCFVKMPSGDLETRSFQFNEWGYGSSNSSEENDWDYSISRRLAKTLGLNDHPVEMISEGGNRISDGKGTVIIVEEVEMRRNPGKTKREIEKILQESIGAQKVIWLPQGLCEDEMTTLEKLPNEKGIPTYYTPLTPGGHIDEFCRFASENTLFLAEVPQSEKHPLSEENAKRLHACYEVLSRERTFQGKNFTIIRVPTGPLLFDRFCPGDTFFSHYQSLGIDPDDKDTIPNYPVILSTSYLNFLALNDTVLVPQYAHETSSLELKERDKQVMEIFSKAFPSRTLIGIDPTNINLAGGGLHCMTLNLPK